MLGHLKVIEPELHDRVATAMGMQGMADEIRAAVAPRDLPPSPALSLLAKAPATLRGRKVGVLVGDGFDAELVTQLVLAIEKEHATVELVAPRIGGAHAAAGQLVPVNHTVGGGPSVIFDAVAIVPGAAGIAELVSEATAVAWVNDAFTHGKVIATIAEAAPLLDAARVTPDAGVIDLAGGAAIARFITAAMAGRIWSREAQVRGPDRGLGAMPPPSGAPDRPRTPPAKL